MTTIYFADDETDIRELVTAFLTNDGYQVCPFETGDALFEAFEKRPCDLIILDIMMPGSDGIAILTKIRKISKVPVILLTAKDSDSDYFNGLSLGSDDYITKPFKPMLLSAKIKALLRRIHFEKEDVMKEEPIVQDIVCGNLRYEARQHRFMAGNAELSLTPTEMRYLLFMMHHFEEAVSKEKVLDEVWNMNDEIESRVADETNRRLRRKMLDSDSDVYIQTVWGYGFKLTRKEQDGGASL